MEETGELPRRVKVRIEPIFEQPYRIGPPPIGPPPNQTSDSGRCWDYRAKRFVAVHRAAEDRLTTPYCKQFALSGPMQSTKRRQAHIRARRKRSDKELVDANRRRVPNRALDISERVIKDI